MYRRIAAAADYAAVKGVAIAWPKIDFTSEGEFIVRHSSKLDLAN